MDVLEFGRIIHAEMSAISDAARLGRSTKGATLFCTTFPCHNCARHIVASGIDRVLYIEPYPKSQAGALYQDSINVEENWMPDDGRVRFVPFTGVAPKRYEHIFKRGRRKDPNGNAVRWTPQNAKPIINQYVTVHTNVEELVGDLLMKELDDKGL